LEAETRGERRWKINHRGGGEKVYKRRNLGWQGKMVSGITEKPIKTRQKNRVNPNAPTLGKKKNQGKAKNWSKFTKPEETFRGTWNTARSGPGGGKRALQKGNQRKLVSCVTMSLNQKRESSI